LSNIPFITFLTLEAILQATDYFDGIFIFFPKKIKEVNSIEGRGRGLPNGDVDGP
jgi:hypothetical protein